jgi:ABC-2 type transport system ATP-binding protein
MNDATVARLAAAVKRYGSLTALDGVDLAVRRGELLALLGPNGAGKSTSLGLLLGLIRPDAGRAELFGLDPQRIEARRRIGVMLQSANLPPTLRVGELLRLTMSYYPSPRGFDETAALAGVTDLLLRPYGKLSGGQQRRVQFALALCGRPELLFLDEPTVGMDVESRRAFLEGIREFVASGRTLVLTTHYLEEADQLAERVVVIDHGRVLADGSPGEIKSRVGGRRITFDTVRHLTPADFEGLPVRSLDLRGQRAWMLSDEPEAVLAALFRRDVEMRNLEVVGADLEEAFLSLTGHDHPAHTEEVNVR